MDKQDFIKTYRKDLARVRENYTIRIAAGELDYVIYNELEGDFRKALKDYHPKIKIIAGPIISVDENTRLNPIIELAEEGLLEFRVSFLHRPNHFRTFGIEGLRFIYQEERHDILADERQGKHSIDLLTISRENYRFDKAIDTLELPKYDGTNLIKMTNKDIQILKRSFEDRFDFKTIEDYKSKAKELGIKTD